MLENEFNAVLWLVLWRLEGLDAHAQHVFLLTLESITLRLVLGFLTCIMVLV